MKRTICLPALLTLFAAPALAQAADGYVTANVNLRAGPDIGYPRVDTIPAGDTVDIYSCTDGWEWCDVAYRGDRGWVAGNYIETIQDDRYAPLPQYGAQFGIPIVTFVISSYWSNYYRERPFYRERQHWYHRPMPHRPSPPPPSRPWHRSGTPPWAQTGGPIPRPKNGPDTYPLGGHRPTPETRPPSTHRPTRETPPREEHRSGTDSHSRGTYHPAPVARPADAQGRASDQRAGSDHRNSSDRRTAVVQHPAPRPASPPRGGVQSNPHSAPAARPAPPARPADAGKRKPDAPSKDHHRGR